MPHGYTYSMTIKHFDESEKQEEKKKREKITTRKQNE